MKSTMTQEKKKTSAPIYREDLKWLNRRKWDKDHENLAETIHEIRQKIEELEEE